MSTLQESEEALKKAKDLQDAVRSVEKISKTLETIYNDNMISNIVKIAAAVVYSIFLLIFKRQMIKKEIEYAEKMNEQHKKELASYIQSITMSRPGSSVDDLERGFGNGQ